jgi:hypothetical protein
MPDRPPPEVELLRVLASVIGPEPQCVTEPPDDIVNGPRVRRRWNPDRARGPRLRSYGGWPASPRSTRTGSTNPAARK